MEAVIIVSGLTLLAASAALFGRDSRPVWDERQRRPWWPGRYS